MTEGTRRTRWAGFTPGVMERLVEQTQEQLRDVGKSNLFRSKDLAHEVVNWMDDPMLEVIPCATLKGYWRISLKGD